MRERERKAHRRAPQRCTFISCEFHVIYFFAARARENLQLLSMRVFALRERTHVTHTSLSAQCSWRFYIYIYYCTRCALGVLCICARADKCPQWRQIERKIGGLWLWRQIKRSSLFRPLMAPQIESRHASWHLSMLIDERKMNHDDCCATLSESYYYYLLPIAKQNPLHVYLYICRHPQPLKNE
jgi:hypothetical protein